MSLSSIFQIKMSKAITHGVSWVTASSCCCFEDIQYALCDVESRRDMPGKRSNNVKMMAVI